MASDPAAASDSQTMRAHFMRLALDEACLALDRQEVPIGCVFVREGQVVATGSNRTTEKRNATRHAELEAIDDLLSEHGGSPEAARITECDLYVTCEPCIMCAGALSLLGIGRVFYGCRNDRFGGNGSILSIHETGCGACSGGPGSHLSYSSEGGLFAEEAVALLREFYVTGNPKAPKPHRTVVLQLPQSPGGHA
ncbi:hypothetical protein WJX72_010241 [[Myrmecia] bisecta]|uniref:CMP/dCMP-type deaminase domain-containing protein n=1 Tax=[Myrmecia] bisecta TaxID=41462 RepID=A0AAW1R8Q6_9CHLO